MRPEQRRRAERALASRIKDRAQLRAFSKTEKTMLQTAADCLHTGKLDDAWWTLRQVRELARMKSELITGYLSQMEMMKLDEVSE